jgi:hypothetical protein
MRKPPKQLNKTATPQFLVAAKDAGMKPGETRNPAGRPKKGFALTDRLMVTGEELINGSTLKLVLPENEQFHEFVKRYIANHGAQPLRTLAVLRLWLEAANGNMIATQIAWTRLEGKVPEAKLLPPDEEPVVDTPQADPYKQVVELVRVLVKNEVLPADTFAKLANGHDADEAEVLPQ